MLTIAHCNFIWQCKLNTRMMYKLCLLLFGLCFSRCVSLGLANNLKVDLNAAEMSDIVTPALDFHVVKHKSVKRSATKITYPCSVSIDDINAGQPKFVLSEESHDISLGCKGCPPPTVEESIPPKIKWTFLPLQGKKYRRVKVNQNDTFISPFNSLLIENISTEKAGFYKCSTYDDILFSAFRIDVVKKEPRFQVSSKADNDHQLKPPIEMKENNLFVFTLWDRWSSCSRCDVRGYKKRVGLCTVKSMRKSADILPVDIPLLRKYPLGIPCRSTALPKVIAALKEIKTRKSETQVEYCWEPCFEAEEVETIKDSNGNIIEVLRPEEMLSLHNVKPTIAPLVIRKTIMDDQGKLMILKCPLEKHYDLKNDIVRWQNNSQVLDGVTLWKDTNDRVHIDVLNRLVIEKTELWDSASYSCWRKEEHLATIKVVIVDKKPDNVYYTKYIYIVGVSLTLFILFCVGINLYQNQKKPK